MSEHHPFVLRDGAVVALAVCTAAGALIGGGPGLVAAIAVIAVALLMRRPVLLCLGVAILAAGLADRAMGGLHPVERSSVRGWATIVTDPEPLDSGGFRAVLLLDGRRVEATAFGAPGRSLADRLSGERVEVSGALRPPPQDAPWLVPRRVVGQFTVEEVLRWEPGSLASRAANGLRRTLEAGASSLPRTARSLMAGVVLGDDRDQPPEVADDFRAAGLSHLLAVSGQNVAFVLVLAGPLLTRLRWRMRLPVTLAVLAAFALLVRFEPSVLRASAMAAVATLAAALGRPAEGIRILALAVTALLLVDPLLVRAIGFGLSVGASAAILLLGPRLRVALRGPGWLVEPLAVTLAAQVGTMPLLVAIFGGLPVASVPANLLAVPAAGPLMVWGLTGGLVAGVANGLVASVLHAPTSVMTWWLAAVARRAAALPLGELHVPHAVALAAAIVVWRALRRLRVEHAGRVLAASVATIVATAALGRATLTAGVHDVTAATLWSGHRGTVLLVDAPVRVERSLEAMRRAGTRCVDVVAIGGGGRSAGLLTAALLRRCGGALAVAPAGEAHPGWIALPPGASMTVGELAVVASSPGEVRVAGVAAARGDATFGSAGSRDLAPTLLRPRLAGWGRSRGWCTVRRPSTTLAPASTGRLGQIATVVHVPSTIDDSCSDLSRHDGQLAVGGGVGERVGSAADAVAARGPPRRARRRCAASPCRGRPRRNPWSSSIAGRRLGAGSACHHRDRRHP